MVLVVAAVEDGGDDGGEIDVSLDVKMRGSESRVSFSVTETGGGGGSRVSSEVEERGGEFWTSAAASGAAVGGFSSAISGNLRV